MEERELRAIARRKIEAGALPGAPEIRVWAGPGINKPCALCERPIVSTDLEYELQIPASEALQPYRFHRLCHAAWALESESLARKPENS
jgi:hypothetical protein